MSNIIDIEEKLNEKKANFINENELPPQKIYGVKDEKTGFNEIFIGSNDMATIRQFAAVCTDEKSPLAKFPQDYSLFYLGMLNPETNTIDAKPHKLAQASDYANKSSQP